MVFGAAIGGLAAGAGSAIEGVAKILTTEIATVNLDLTPKQKKKAKATGKISTAIKISPLSIFFGIDLVNFARTGTWSFSLLETLFGGLPGTLTEGIDTVTESRGHLSQYTSDPQPLVKWAFYTETQRDDIVREITQRRIEIRELERQALAFDTAYIDTGDQAYIKQARDFRAAATRYEGEIKQIRDNPGKFFRENPEVFETIP